MKKKPDLKRRSSSRITGNQQGWSVLFPEECYFCGKYRITKNRREHLPIRMLTEAAKMTVKESAKVKDIELYSKIVDTDLIAREFRYHTICYRDFTRDKPEEKDRPTIPDGVNPGQVDERSKSNLPEKLKQGITSTARSLRDDIIKFSNDLPEPP